MSNYKYDGDGNLDHDPKGWKLLGVFLVTIFIMNLIGCSGWWLGGAIVVFLLIVLNDAYVKGDI